MTTEKLTPEELLANLGQFYGTQEWHRWSILFPRFLLTDGAKYLAEKAGAYWLMDIIGSYQPQLLKKGEDFQVWKVEVFPAKVKRNGKEYAAVVICEDGNNNVLKRQYLEFTDFPLTQIKLYFIWDGQNGVVLLPSEY